METIRRIVRQVWGCDTLLPLQEEAIGAVLARRDSIFSNASLREMARRRPTTEEEFLAVKGVGARKLQELGPRFLACIRAQAGTASNPSP